MLIIDENRFSDSDKRIDLPNILSHAMNSVIMFVDILIVAYPIRLYHVIQPICFGTGFGLFSYIYYLCGGVNQWVEYWHCNKIIIKIKFINCFFRKNQPFIYPTLNWAKPKKALTTMAAVLILVVIVHTILFFICKLRIFTQRRFFATEAMLPITKEQTTPM